MPIIEGLDDPGLVAVIIANTSAYNDLMTMQPGEVTLHEQPGLLWVSSEQPGPYANRVMQTRLTEREADRRIAAMLTEFQRRGLPFCWRVDPLTQPPDLAARLTAQGLRLWHQSPYMLIDLQQLADFPMLPGLSIRLVEDEAGLQQTGVIAAASFGFSIEDNRAFLRHIFSLSPAQREPLHFYLATLNGQPVATAILYLAGGVANIHRVATLPEFRRRGLGAAVTLTALRAAYQVGYRVGSLQSSAVAYNLYRNLGFIEVFKADTYIWQPDFEANQEGVAL